MPLPAATRWAAGKTYAALDGARDVVRRAPLATHEDIVAQLKPAFGDAASITEQIGAWVRFDLSAPTWAR